MIPNCVVGEFRATIFTSPIVYDPNNLQRISTVLKAEDGYVPSVVPPINGLPIPFQAPGIINQGIPMDWEMASQKTNIRVHFGPQKIDILKNTHKSLYDRFLPVSKRNSQMKFKGKINELLKEYKRFNKFDGLDMVPYKPSDIVTFIHKQNENKLNASISTATTKFLSMLSDKQEVKIDTSFKTNEVLVNAEAAMKEAEIMANIKSINKNTKY